MARAVTGAPNCPPVGRTLALTPLSPVVAMTTPRPPVATEMAKLPGISLFWGVHPPRALLVLRARPPAIPVFPKTTTTSPLGTIEGHTPNAASATPLGPSISGAVFRPVHRARRTAPCATRPFTSPSAIVRPLTAIVGVV